MFYYDYETICQSTMQKIWNIINNSKSSDWWRENPTVEWKISLPYDIFEDDPKSKRLVQEFVEPNRLYIQKLEPKTSYFWHIDYARYTSITMGLNEFENSYTLFGGPREGNHIPNLDPLRYKPNHAYLTDGSKLHCGVNLSNQTRYLLSVSLTKPANLKSTIEFLKTNF